MSCSLPPARSTTPTAGTLFEPGRSRQLNGTTSPLSYGPGHITQWEDRYRQVASVLVWMQITQGERLCAPLVRAHRQPGTKSQLRADLCQAAYHGRRRFLILQEVIQPYAQQLADRIDHGEAIISGLFPA
jgi:hypothetical protein